MKFRLDIAGYKSNWTSGFVLDYKRAKTAILDKMFDDL